MYFINKNVSNNRILYAFLSINLVLVLTKTPDTGTVYYHEGKDPLNEFTCSDMQ